MRVKNADQTDSCAILAEAYDGLDSRGLLWGAFSKDVSEGGRQVMASASQN
jgi:hypothetical protein